MRIWFVDVFADHALQGAQAAIIPLDHWLPEETLQAIAAENGAAETTFLTSTGLKGNYEIRAYTPRREAALSGHGVLAAGAVLISEIDRDLEIVVFDAASGPLVVRRAADGYTLDLPRRLRTPWTPAPALLSALEIGAAAEEGASFAGAFATLVLESERALRALTPDPATIERHVPGPIAGCLTVTAPADTARDQDFVARVFAPGAGVAEDAVTASAFADLIPYWCDRLGKAAVIGVQASHRGGVVRGMQTLSSSRLMGPVTVYLRGELDAAVFGQPGGRAGRTAAAPRGERDLVVRLKEPPARPRLVTVFAPTADIS